jgi:hypothetical protein
MLKKFGLAILVILCMTSLSACLSKYEKKMVGVFVISELTVSGQTIDVSVAFDEAKVEMTSKREFNLVIAFNESFLDGAEVHKIIEDVLKDPNNTGANLDSDINEIIASLKEGYHIKGTFTNNNGKPVFTPSGDSKKFSDYGFTKIDFDFVESALIIHGSKFIITDFIFKKI